MALMVFTAPQVALHILMLQQAVMGWMEFIAVEMQPLQIARRVAMEMQASMMMEVAHPRFQVVLPTVILAKEYIPQAVEPSLAA